MTLAKKTNIQDVVEIDLMADSAREASEFLKALAHESRLMILCNLLEGEKSVGELEAFLSLRQSTVSQQLARLRTRRPRRRAQGREDHLLQHRRRQGARRHRRPVQHFLWRQAFVHRIVARSAPVGFRRGAVGLTRPPVEARARDFIRPGLKDRSRYKAGNFPRAR